MVLRTLEREIMAESHWYLSNVIIYNSFEEGVILSCPSIKMQDEHYIDMAQLSLQSFYCFFTINTILKS